MRDRLFEEFIRNSRKLYLRGTMCSPEWERQLIEIYSMGFLQKIVDDGVDLQHITPSDVHTYYDPVIMRTKQLHGWYGWILNYPCQDDKDDIQMVVNSIEIACQGIGFLHNDDVHKVAENLRYGVLESIRIYCESPTTAIRMLQSDYLAKLREGN